MERESKEVKRHKIMDQEEQQTHNRNDLKPKRSGGQTIQEKITELQQAGKLHRRSLSTIVIIKRILGQVGKAKVIHIQ